jgi:hypothetical protein
MADGGQQAAGDDDTFSVIIAGTRTFGAALTDEGAVRFVEAALAEAGFDPDEVVSGHADGADSVGEAYAAKHGIPVADAVHDDLDFHADWDQHGRAAGPIRNERMAEYGDALLALWDGESPGTRSMIETAGEHLDDEAIYVIEYERA